MSATEFLESDKKLSDLSRAELHSLLFDKNITAWLYQEVSEELKSRIR
jgi:hypothetical protein